MSAPLMPRIVEVDGRPFVVNPWSASQTFDALLLLGEILSEPLSKILGRPVSKDLGGVVEAFQEAGERALNAGQLFSLFASLRAAGGSTCLTRVLMTTRWQDQPLASVEAIDRAFAGPEQLLPLMRLTWEVLRYQLAPFAGALQPLLSSAGAALDALKTRAASGPT